MNRNYIYALLVLFAASQAIASVVTYPMPAGESPSPDYTISVDGQPVPVYRAVTHLRDKKYSIAYFDFSGTATVTIKTKLPLDRLQILPAKYGFTPTINGNEATFTVDRPFNISFEPIGFNSPLELFGNPVDPNPPKPTDPNVVYFGPGVHKPGIINLTSGQTLFIAGGAVVKAGVQAVGDNIRITGRGILDGNDWPHGKGPTYHLVDIFGGHNDTLENLILRGAFHWTVCAQRSSGITIRNIRICGSRVGNDDGIDPCNCSNIDIEDCFIRTDDDCIAVKGTSGDLPIDGIRINGCSLWSDWANVFRIGFESRAPAMRNVTVSDIDVIHALNTANKHVFVFEIQPGGNMAMENLLFENIRINGEFPQNLVSLQPMPISSGWGVGPGKPVGDSVLPPGKTPPESHIVPTSPGDGPYIHNVIFRNINVSGPDSPDAIVLHGLDDRRNIDNVLFEDFSRHGVLIQSDSPGIRIQQFATNIKFLPAATTQP
jgi:hypothetical protein